MCGCLYVQSLLYAVKLSFEALFNICGKETRGWCGDSGSTQTYSASLEISLWKLSLECSYCLLTVPQNAKPLRLA